MKRSEQTNTNTTSQPSFAKACLGSCQKLIARIERAKDIILGEFRETLQSHEQLLRLALNEAEALAWQTEFPQLVFPTLAMEKAHAVAMWGARQRSVRQTKAAVSHAA